MTGKFSLTFFLVCVIVSLRENHFFSSGNTHPKYKIESVQKGMQLKKCLLSLKISCPVSSWEVTKVVRVSCTF